MEFKKRPLWQYGYLGGNSKHQRELDAQVSAFVDEHGRFPNNEELEYLSMINDVMAETEDKEQRED